MAKGKGEIKGWITRHGVHIPIYDKYTVREGHEPGEKGMKTSVRWGKQAKRAKFRNEIEKDIASKYDTYWHGDKEMAKFSVKYAMERVDRLLDYFEEKKQDFIEPSEDYDKDIVWKFSGKDKSTGKYAGFEFNGYPRETDARDNLKFNGYTVSQGLILPKPLFNYLMDRTNVEEDDIYAAKAVMKQALKEYKATKGIKRHG